MYRSLAVACLTIVLGCQRPVGEAISKDKVEPSTSVASTWSSPPSAAAPPPPSAASVVEVAASPTPTATPTSLVSIANIDPLDVPGSAKSPIVWKPSPLAKWIQAVDGYVPAVKPGKLTALNGSAIAWATYLSDVHRRLHPLFADQFIESLSAYPPSYPMNQPTLKTVIEVVLRPDGAIHHLGIVRSSGLTAFDLGALDAFDRAAPFGPAPAAIISPDGLAYFHWELHRDDIRCSTINARPYLLK